MGVINYTGLVTEGSCVDIPIFLPSPFPLLKHGAARTVPEQTTTKNRQGQG